MHNPKSSICLLLLALSLQHAYAKPPAVLAGTLSVIPGLGQAISGRPLEGLGWIAAVGGAYFVSPFWALNLLEYNMYDAYRDAKPRGGNTKNHNVFQNYIAVLNPLNAIDPIGGPLLYFYGIGYRGQNLGRPTVNKFFAYHLVGLGEEALFRGFLFPAISYSLSSKLVGALLSSAIFGAVHTQYGIEQRAIVALVGLIQCWQINNNKYDLRKNIFAHTWIDIFVGDKTLNPGDTSSPLGVKLSWSTSL